MAGSWIIFLLLSPILLLQLAYLLSFYPVSLPPAPVSPQMMPPSKAFSPSPSYVWFRSN